MLKDNVDTICWYRYLNMTWRPSYQPPGGCYPSHSKLMTQTIWTGSWVGCQRDSSLALTILKWLKQNARLNGFASNHWGYGGRLVELSVNPWAPRRTRLIGWTAEWGLVVIGRNPQIVDFAIDGTSRWQADRCGWQTCNTTAQQIRLACRWPRILSRWVNTVWINWIVIVSQFGLNRWRRMNILLINVKLASHQ